MVRSALKNCKGTRNGTVLFPRTKAFRMTRKRKNSFVKKASLLSCRFTCRLTGSKNTRNCWTLSQPQWRSRNNLLKWRSRCAQKLRTANRRAQRMALAAAQESRQSRSSVDWCRKSPMPRKSRRKTWPSSSS